MARIRLNLKKLSVTDKIAKGRQIVTAMTNNASFPNPNPPLPEVTAALDELNQSFAQVQAAKSEITTRVATQDNAVAKVDQVLTQLASYVESVAGRDDTLITSAGMETKASRSAPTAPITPQGLSATTGERRSDGFASKISIYAETAIPASKIYLSLLRSSDLSRLVRSWNAEAKT